MCILQCTDTVADPRKGASIDFLQVQPLPKLGDSDTPNPLLIVDNFPYSLLLQLSETYLPSRHS